MSNHRKSLSSIAKTAAVATVAGISTYAYFAEPEFHNATSLTYKIIAPLAVGISTTLTTAVGTAVGGIVGGTAGFDVESARKSCLGIIVGSAVGFGAGMGIGYKLSSMSAKTMVQAHESNKTLSYQENVTDMMAPKLNTVEAFNNNDIAKIAGKDTLVLNNFAPKALAA